MQKREPKAVRQAESVLEVRVVLHHSVPAIWRLLEVGGSLALDQMHQVLQVAFDWEDLHLHRFTALEPFVRLQPVNGVIPEDLQWLPRQGCFEPDDGPEEDLSLEQLFALGSGVAFYEYDFGDSWLHKLELVSRRPVDEGAPPARLIDGARRGPLENSGGMQGYEQILDALANPKHPDHAECAAWVAEITGSDDPFDPRCLDVAAVNQELSDLL